MNNNQSNKDNITSSTLTLERKNSKDDLSSSKRGATNVDKNNKPNSNSVKKPIDKTNTDKTKTFVKRNNSGNTNNRSGFKRPFNSRNNNSSFKRGPGTRNPNFKPRNPNSQSKSPETLKKELEKKKILWRKSSWKRKPVSKYKFKLLQIKRVTKVTKGGRLFRFLAVALAGDENGRIGFGTGKGNEVVTARQKAFDQAEKNIIYYPNFKKTIPHEVSGRFCSSKILLKPASEGTGVLLGGSARAVVELLGITNIRGKSLGSNNKINLIQSTLNALSKLRTPQEVMRMRDLKENPQKSK